MARNDEVVKHTDPRRAARRSRRTRTITLAVDHDQLMKRTRAGRRALKAGYHSDLSPDELLFLVVLSRIKGGATGPEVDAIVDSLIVHYGSAEAAIEEVKAGQVRFTFIDTIEEAIRKKGGGR